VLIEDFIESARTRRRFKEEDIVTERE